METKRNDCIQILKNTIESVESQVDNLIKMYTAMDHEYFTLFEMKDIVKDLIDLVERL